MCLGMQYGLDRYLARSHSELEYHWQSWDHTPELVELLPFPRPLLIKSKFLPMNILYLRQHHTQIPRSLFHNPFPNHLDS